MNNTATTKKMGGGRIIEIYNILQSNPQLKQIMKIAKELKPKQIKEAITFLQSKK